MPGARHRLAASALGLAVLAVVVLVLTSGGSPTTYTVTASMSSAIEIFPGLSVREAGQPVGEVSRVWATRGGVAEVQLAIGRAAWPLPQGTRMRLRWASTIAYSGRYVELDKPARPGPPIPDGGTIPTRDVIVPVEFNQLFDTFNATTRRGLRSLLQNGGASLANARAGLTGTLAAGPQTLHQVNLVLDDLNANTTALDTLIRSSDRVTGAIQSASPGLGTLLSGAAATFAAAGDEAAQLKATLQEAPTLISTAKRTLSHADSTLTAAGTLTERLAPGVSEVRRLAAPLDNVLGTIVQVGPDATSTLQTAGHAAPSLTELLATARRLMPTLKSLGSQSATELNCVRPYTPDIVAFASTWSGFIAPTDSKDHIGRIVASTIGFSNATTLTPGQAHALIPGLTSAFPRPPGDEAGQPWFIPECGVGPASVIPAADPEALK